MSTFADFTRDFFSTLGCDCSEQAGRLHVALTDDLAAHYGRESLVLTFTPHDAQGELVAHGSRAFEQMQDFLATRGRLATCRLPAASEPLAPLSLVNGECLPLGEQDAPRWYYVLNYHLAFLSDERVEQLIPYCLDAEGRFAPEAAAWLEASEGGESLAEAHELPPGVLLAAERAVLEEAEQLSLPMETATLERLRKVAGRLVAYYEELMTDVPVRRRKGQDGQEALEAADEERWRLRRELEHKLAEETTRHQLRVQIRRVSQAVLRVPGSFTRHRLSTPHAERQVAVWHNRFTAESEWPACQRCGHEGAAIGLCAHGHLTCPECLGQCVNCELDLCKSELDSCEACGAASCATCLAECTAGHRVCQRHLSACTCCGQAYCGTCLAHCPDCPPDVQLAIAHASPCATCHRPLCQSHQTPCALCGSFACQEHAAACPGCGDVVCRSHMGACAQCELEYCSRCRDVDLQRASEPSHCRACGAVGHAGYAPKDWLGAIASLPNVGRYDHWHAIENDRYRYLLGRGLLGDLLVVTDFNGDPVKVKEIGFWRKLFGWMG